MGPMLLNVLLIAVGIVFVSYGARFLVRGASSLAKRFQVSDLVIGLTVVAFGTSAPELTVTVLAAAEGQTDVALGNVLGSNLLNICLILGVSSLIMPLTVQQNTVWKEIPLGLLGIMVAFAMAYDALIDGAPTSEISRSDGWVLLAFFLIYMYYMLDLAREGKEPVTADRRILPVWLSAGLVAVGLFGLTYGGHLIVTNAVDIARYFGVSEALIGLTLVSVGTSIPELATSVVATMQGKTDIAVGNVVGSNIFNTFLILGVSSVITPLPLGNITMVDFLATMFATLLLFAGCFISTPRVLYRLEGMVFLGFYGLYLVYLLSHV